MQYVLVFCVFVLCFSITRLLFSKCITEEKIVNNRLNKFLGSSTETKGELEKLNQSEGMLKHFNTVISNRLVRLRSEKLQNLIKRSGVRITPEEYNVYRCVVIAGLSGSLYVLSNNIVLALLSLPVGYIIPKMWIKHKIQLRLDKFNKSLPDMISTIIGSLKTGYSFMQALQTVAEECDQPVKEEIEFLLKELSYGLGLEDGFNNLLDRMPSEDLGILIQVVLIHREVGGNLAEVLEIILETIRDRYKVQRQIKTLTSQGRFSGRVIGSLPVVLGLGFYITSPAYISVLFTTSIGITCVCTGVCSCLIGFFLISKLTKINV